MFTPRSAGPYGKMKPHLGDRAPVAVLGHSSWLRRFGGDQSIVGQEVTLEWPAVHDHWRGSRELQGAFAFSEAEFYLPVNWTTRSVLDDRERP